MMHDFRKPDVQRPFSLERDRSPAARPMHHRLREMGTVAFRFGLGIFVRSLRLDRHIPMGRVLFRRKRTAVSALVGIGRRHGIRQSPGFLLLGKTLLTLDGVVRQLDPEFNLVEEVKAAVPGILLRRLLPSRVT